MKTINSIFVGVLFTLSLHATTCTIHSGKWTDPLVWSNHYIGSTIIAGDMVIITGQVTMNTALVIEGTLEIKKGAGLIGMNNLTISKNGKLLNNGNTVVKEMVNRGNISNSGCLEAITNIENQSAIENTSHIIACNNLSSSSGNISGRDGSFYGNHSVSISASTEVSSGIKFFCENESKTAVSMRQPKP